MWYNVKLRFLESSEREKLSTTEDKSVGSDFAAHAKGLLLADGWTEEQIERGLGLVGSEVISFFGQAAKLRRRNGDRAVRLVEQVLSMKSLEEACNRVRQLGLSNHVGQAGVVAYVRTILVALGGKYDMESDLDDCTPQAPPPRTLTLNPRTSIR